MVFIGNLKQIEFDLKSNKSATLNNLFTIKGEPTSEIRLCPNFQDEFGKEGYSVELAELARANNRVYFFKKKNGCYIGVHGYNSTIPIKINTNCIAAEFAYQFEKEYIDKFEPLELFVKKLVGDSGIVSFPESLKTEKCE